jgi:glycosyltransferase involved in cell wall biosynthesis
MLKQSVKAEQIIVIDASQCERNIKLTKFTCANLKLKFQCKVIYQKSEFANLCYQRNQGLRDVKSDIVMLPDDDSFWFPDTVERILDAYRLDTDKVIAGISSLAVSNSPLAPIAKLTHDSDNVDTPPQKRRLKQRLRIRLTEYKKRFEQKYIKQPFFEHARGLYALKETPQCLKPGLLRLTPSISGYAMSYRTAIIKQLNFDETLGYKSGYAFHEDRLASLMVLNKGYFLGFCSQSKVHHFSHEQHRNKGFTHGFTNIANYIYCCKKALPDTIENQAMLSKLLKYKLFLFYFRRANPYYNQVYLGAKAAYKNAQTLLTCKSEEHLSEEYQRLCDHCIIE